MALKKESLSRKQRRNESIVDTKVIEQNEENAKPSYTDFMCPICLQLLIEPVVMPCNHELCMPCFKTHVQFTSLCCPMCRIRISNWARLKSRKGDLVDKKRWKYIQSLFPDLCRRRLNGEEEDDDDSILTSSNYIPMVAKEGEVRQEYENEIKKVKEELEEEIRANEEAVKKILEEENAIQKELEKDEQIAKELQQQELDMAGSNLNSPSSKLTAMLNAWKMPQEMRLRSKSVSENRQKLVSDKSKSPLTNWLSKSNQGNTKSSVVGSSIELFSKTPRRSKQEEDDFAMALKVQKKLDLEGKQHERPKTVSDHFYSLKCERMLRGREPPEKRLKTDEHH